MAQYMAYEYDVCWLQSDGSFTMSMLAAEDEATTWLYHEKGDFYMPFDWGYS